MTFNLFHVITCLSKSIFVEGSSLSMLLSKALFLGGEILWSTCCCRQTFHNSHKVLRSQSLLQEWIRSSGKVVQVCEYATFVRISVRLTLTVKLLSNLNFRLFSGDFSLLWSFILEHECDFCNALGLELPISLRMGLGVNVCFKMLCVFTWKN